MSIQLALLSVQCTYKIKTIISVFQKSWAMKCHGCEGRGRKDQLGHVPVLELDLTVVYVLSPSVIWC